MPTGIYQHKMGKHWKLKKKRKTPPFTEEHKRKISQNNPRFWLGKHLSEKTKQKISKANKITLFKKGHIPWHKGRKMNDYPQMGFQKGHLLFHHMVGSNHPRWIKNRDILKRNERNDPEYKQWVKKVKKRDKNICRINNQDCFGYNIVHHILSWRDYPELRYEIKNGITLCQFHHPKVRNEEKRLIPFFNGLVSVSN